MRIIKGFLCVLARTSSSGRKEFFLFGKNMGRGNGSYENLLSNQLTPFPYLSHARVARKELMSRQVSDLQGPIDIRRVSMTVIQSEDELELFRKSQNLIVIMDGDFDQRLLGRLVEGMPTAYPLPGADLTLNGLKPLANMKNALHVMSEAKRQGWTAARIATFTLTDC